MFSWIRLAKRIQNLKVVVRAFGPISEALGRLQFVELPSGSTLQNLAEKLQKETALRVPPLLNSNLRVLVNGTIATMSDQVLVEGDRVDILSPFAGG
jgi:molybdopterin converting factor small subunit